MVILNMISLEMEDYCQNCRYFEPAKELTEAVCTGFNDEDNYVYNIVIFCKERKRCANMYKVLKRRFEKDDRSERCE